MKTRKALYLFLLTLWIADANAIPVPSLDLPRLIKESDVIVVGSAADGTLGGQSLEDSPDAFSLEPERILQGTLPNTSARILIHKPPLRAGNGEIIAGQRGLFFLKANTDGTYSVVDGYYPMLPLWRHGSLALKDSDDIMDKVSAELIQVLDATNPESISDAWRGAVYGKVDYLVVGEALETIPYAASAKYCRELSQSKQSMNRIWANVCMINAGDFSAFKSIKDALLASSNDDAVVLLTTAIEGHVPPADCVPELSSLLRSSNVQVRRASAQSLREIGTPDLIEPLRSIALNDTDRMVRYYAVAGLEKATGGQEPSIQLFSEREESYMSKWRAWSVPNAQAPKIISQ